MCHSAAEAGITEIAFTDHLNNHRLDMDLGFYRADAYFESLEKCRRIFPNLIIRAGVEVGEPHRWAHKVQPILEQYPYDVVLGSVHWVGDESVFAEATYRKRPSQEAYALYFAEVLRMVRNGGFDVLAHVDLPKRVAYDVYHGFDTNAHEAALRSIWEACIESGIALEINTKALRNSVHETHPTVTALAWYREQGGDLITLGSDAHRPEHIGYGFDIAMAIAGEAGLTTVCQFEKRTIRAMVALSNATHVP
jgi:histidinol-phosphatase (PHP family)